MFLFFLFHSAFGEEAQETHSDGINGEDAIETQALSFVFNVMQSSYYKAYT